MPLLQEYGRSPIEILTRQTLQDYLNNLTELSYTTHHRHQAIVQALFNFALEQGYLKANPIASPVTCGDERDGLPPPTGVMSVVQDPALDRFSGNATGLSAPLTGSSNCIERPHVTQNARRTT